MPPPSIPDYPAVLASRRAELRAQVASRLAGVRALTLEIGCGHGHFLTAYAAAHPELHCLGLDIANDRIARALRKRDRARLPYFAEARAVVAEHADWRLQPDAAWPFEHVTVFQARADAHESFVAFRRPPRVSASG
jgi:tRNA G46 methylase TrmB